MSRRIQPKPSFARIIFAGAFIMAAALFALGCYDNHDVTIEGLSSGDAGAPMDDGDMMSDEDMTPDDDDMTGNECGSCEPVAPNPTLGLIGIEPTSCCTEDDKCGLEIQDAGCMERDQEGTITDECSGVSLGGFISLDGCCRPDGTCGIMDDMIGYGCTNALSMLGLGGGGEGGEPETCEYTELE